MIINLSLVWWMLLTTDTNSMDLIYVKTDWHYSGRHKHPICINIKMAYIKELLISLITEWDNRHNPHYASVVNVRCIYRYIPIYILLLVIFFSLLLLLLHTSHFVFVLVSYTVMSFGLNSSCRHNNMMYNYPLTQFAKP